MWTKPEHSRGEVDRAGRVLIDPRSKADDLASALIIINNWRSSHSFPLNTLQMSLRKKSTQVDSKAVVAQRIKRISSISSKLERFPTMKLSRMQDLGGARAVMPSVTGVRQVEELFLKSSHKHSLVRSDDYIDHPKDTGYRGVHLVYRYFSDRSDIYNGLHIELQLRSILQHRWATAVETVGTFTQQSLKASSGDDDWLRFFALMASEVALKERCPLVPGTPLNRDDHKAELIELVKSLNVIDRLTAYRLTSRASSQVLSGEKFFLLELNIASRELKVSGFRSQDDASAAFDAAERKMALLADRTSWDTVLVAADSMKSLQKAFPNYYLDTMRFVQMVEQAVGI